MRPLFLISMLSLAAAAPAHAEVIEISDDGEARILGAQESSTPGLVERGVPTDRRSIIPAMGPTDRAAVERQFSYSAQRHGIDVELLRAVAWTESRGRNDAVSPKGARGIMQLMPGTAAALGVDPRDPLANIDGGAKYLAQQLATFRSVPLALAAYNAGPGAVTKYRGVPPYAETRGYVKSIMQRWSPAANAAPPTWDKASIASVEPQLPEAEPQPVFVIEVADL